MLQLPENFIEAGHQTAPEAELKPEMGKFPKGLGVKGLLGSPNRVDLRQIRGVHSGLAKGVLPGSKECAPCSEACEP